MPDDLTLQPVSSASADRPVEAVAPSLRAPGIASSAGGESAPFANPTLSIDPELGMVVIEFRNSAGAVVSSIPSHEQLDAYRQLGDATVAGALAQADAAPSIGPPAAAGEDIIA